MWLPDGNIEMIGRIDDQVKIRGYRVEPGEIETRLLEHNGISKAAVAVKADGSGNPIICAYFVAKQVLSETEVKAYLARNLPEYFLPSLVVQMESLPLTPNGKVDKKLCRTLIFFVRCSSTETKRLTKPSKYLIRSG